MTGGGGLKATRPGRGERTWSSTGGRDACDRNRAPAQHGAKRHLGSSLLRAAVATVTAAVLGIGASVAQAKSTTTYGVLPDGGQWVADVPSDWNGDLILFSHGFLEQAPEDSPDPTTQSDLLEKGYALAGSSYQTTGSLWALDSAVRDQFETEAAVEKSLLPSRPKLVIALGESMGGLVSALEDQDSDGRINGALTTCGIVAGAVNLENYQLDGSYAISALLAPIEHIQLVGYQTEAQAALAGTELQNAAQQAQQSVQGRARLALASALYNVTTWTATDLEGEDFNPLVTPPPGPPPATAYNEQEEEQYETQYAPGSIIEPFMETGRWTIEQAVDGQPAWDVGVNFTKLLAASPYLPEVQTLYKEAHLNLDADLTKLTAGANIKAQLPALKNLINTSVPTGKLQVPELDIHTIADELVPVQQENFYRHTVDAAGDSQLLRQAYVEAEGHCNFTPPEYIAGLEAVEHRIRAGQATKASHAIATKRRRKTRHKHKPKRHRKAKHRRKGKRKHPASLWGSVTTAKWLQATALSLHEGSAAFIPFDPGPLTGTAGPFDPSKQGTTSSLMP
jgi:hypothetical protein